MPGGGAEGPLCTVEPTAASRRGALHRNAGPTAIHAPHVSPNHLPNPAPGALWGPSPQAEAWGLGPGREGGASDASVFLPRGPPPLVGQSVCLGSFPVSPPRPGALAGDGALPTSPPPCSLTGARGGADRGLRGQAPRVPAQPCGHPGPLRPSNSLGPRPPLGGGLFALPVFEGDGHTERLSHLPKVTQPASGFQPRPPALRP